MFKKNILHQYLFKSFLKWILFLIAGFSVFIMLFNFIELLRRSQSLPDITSKSILKITLLELPGFLDQFFPFIILFAVMLLLWNLNRHSEIIVIRTMGVSIWSIMTPFVLVISLYSVLYLTIFNPIIASSQKAAEILKGKVFQKQKNSFSIANSGLWLRQTNSGGYSIIHINNLKDNNSTLEKLTIYNFNSNDSFLNRIDGHQALIKANGWLIPCAFLSKSSHVMEPIGNYFWPTTLTFSKLQQSFDSPNTISVWKLPKFIKLVENTGFGSTEHKLHFYELLAKPFLIFSMVLLGAISAFSFYRQKNSFSFILIGLLLGFTIFLLHHILFALGVTLKVPLLVSAWLAPLVTSLIGITTLMHLEEK